jgi:hypothetical protein
MESRLGEPRALTTWHGRSVEPSTSTPTMPSCSYPFLVINIERPGGGGPLDAMGAACEPG